MTLDPRTPVLVGVGQVTNRRERLVQPLELMVEAAAAADSDAGGGALARVTEVDVANLVSWSYTAPAQALADALGLVPGDRFYTTVGGNTAQLLVSRACDRITSGETDGVLIAGAEALDSVRRQRADGVKVERGDREAPVAEPLLGDDRSPVVGAELSARVVAPATVYAMFESALAARAGRTPDEHRRFIGDLMAPFTKVAASHRNHAWFPVERTSEEIATVSPDNRLVGEPYTKLMNAVMQVDMSAALILLSAEAAEAAGVPRERWVFPWAGADATEIFIVGERPEILDVPALRAAHRALLDASGVGIDDLATIDIYACFPSAVQIGAEAMGIALDDPRGLTVTGGLPYFGGPGNNYVSHSVAITAERLREQSGSLGLVTGVGWYMTKHSLGLYGTEPPPNAWRHEHPAVPADGSVELTTDADGEATVEAFTVDHDRDGSALSAPVYARLSDGRRVVANTSDPDAVSGENLVGTTVKVRGGSYEPG